MCGVCLADVFFFSSRRRHTSCALVTGVQTCALPIFALYADVSRIDPVRHAGFLPALVVDRRQQQWTFRAVADRRLRHALELRRAEVGLAGNEHAVNLCAAIIVAVEPEQHLDRKSTRLNSSY